MWNTKSARALTVLIGATVLAGALGTTCNLPGLGIPIGGISPAVVTVELVNTTAVPVDPGLFIDGFQHVIDPPIAPGDVVTLAVDCYPGTRLETDATLLDITPLASENVPLLVESGPYVCGDVVSFVFIEDALGFFTNVEVNGVVVQ